LLKGDYAEIEYANIKDLIKEAKSKDNCRGIGKLKIYLFSPLRFLGLISNTIF
jgi:hypothetical protein